MKKIPGDIIILHLCTKSEGSRDMECDGQKFMSFWDFCPSSPLTAPRKSKFWINEKNIWRYTCVPQMETIWCMVREIWSVTGHFLSFYPFKNLRNQHFEKTKKAPGVIIILHLGNTIGNYMMYGSWDIERNGQNFLSFWTNFCPFTILNTWKIKILKTWKKCLEILSFYTCVP